MRIHSSFDNELWIRLLSRMLKGKLRIWNVMIGADPPKMIQGWTRCWWIAHSVFVSKKVAGKQIPQKVFPARKNQALTGTTQLGRCVLSVWLFELEAFNFQTLQKKRGNVVQHSKSIFNLASAPIAPTLMCARYYFRVRILATHDIAT